jgi:hypothetical protein
MLQEFILLQTDLILTVIILISCSIGLRLFFEKLGQSWISTYAHTATLTLLPLITFVITKVISGNIALSLGMVGALSIVRFRNPVRSPLELSVYFLAITMGIAASVSLKWLLFLITVTILAFVLLSLASFLSKVVWKRTFFNASFSEGNNVSTLEITSIKNIDILSNSNFLKSESFNGDSTDYLLVSNNVENLKIILAKSKALDSNIIYRINVA